MNKDERRRIAEAANDNFKLATDFTNLAMTYNQRVTHQVNLSVAASLIVIADVLQGLVIDTSLVSNQLADIAITLRRGTS